MASYKILNMKTPIKMKYIALTVISTIILVACGGSDLDSKKKEVEDLKSQTLEIKQQIATLEKEITAIDPSYAKKKVNAVLVTAMKMTPEYFSHKIDVRGSVQSRMNVTVSAEIPGKVESVLVKEGQKVKKGDLLFTQDGDIISNNIAELETALELATIVAKKQENLYEQNVGTEIQYLQAKNNKESLERRLATAKSQLRQARVRAPFPGTIDRVDVKVGEMAQPGMPLVRIVNPNDVHVSADVSERFISKFKKGDPVDIYFPTLDKTIKSTVTSVGQVINAENRTFEMEINLPPLGFAVRPNQVVVLSLVDYETSSALKVPTKIVLRDNKGNYIYGLEKSEDKTIAKKVYVEPGISFNNETEILSGLIAGQLIALEGYRELVEGVVVDVMKEPRAQAGNNVIVK